MVRTVARGWTPSAPPCGFLRSRTFALARGATLTPSVELGLRQDGGDAETGTGLEFGSGVGYADPSRGLDMALRVHGLAAHAEQGYEE